MSCRLVGDSSPAPARSSPRTARRGFAAIARELACLAALYIGYALTRVLADDALGPARARAATLVDIEQRIGLSFEQPLNAWFATHDVVGALSAFHYASAHYVVTAAVMLWLFLRSPRDYLVARQALVGVTLIALAIYLLAPTAPPRLVGGFTDVLAQHSSVGWWGAQASAPKGLGEYTNQLAAFPSMHGGWALWVALVVAASTPKLVPQLLAWSHAAVTAVVIVGTGNHWTLDVVVGWALVALVWWTAKRRSTTAGRASRPGSPDAPQAPSRSARRVQ